MLATNKIRQTGALARTGTLTLKGEKQTPVFEATVAMTTTVNGREHTAYVPVYALGKAAQRLFDNTAAGTTINLDGVVRQEKWQQDGQKRSRTRIHVLSSEVLEAGELLTDNGGGQRLISGALNSAVLGGNLVAQPVLRSTKADGSGDAVVDFSLALNSSYTNAQGKKVEVTDYVDVVAWRDLALKIANLPKGAPLMVECAAQSDSWTNKDGEKRSALKFQATKIDVVVVPAAVQQAAPVQATPVSAAPEQATDLPPVEERLPDDAYPDTPEEDDLPF